MKLNKKEIIIFSVIFFIVLFGIFFFVLLTPIQKTLAANQQELAALVQTDKANQEIIDSVSSLQTAKEQLEEEISVVEQNLLPYLKAEVITEHIVNILEKSGLKFVTNISALKPEASEDTVSRPDGTESQISTNSLELKIEVSGTDGYTDGGIPYIGYDQFIRAVKDIEDEHPQAIRIRSIEMEDTQKGFQKFFITINVYSFNIPTPVSTYDATQKYINWYRSEVPLGGLIGIPYAMCVKPEEGSLYRPFASYTTDSESMFDPNSVFVPETTETTEPVTNEPEA